MAPATLGRGVHHITTAIAFRLRSQALLAKRNRDHGNAFSCGFLCGSYQNIVSIDVDQCLRTIMC
ncbi:MAG: hypothetical protein N6V49_04090 [Serratia symbiotica]|nr:hypothetical protein [Serratia symbiotica]